MPKSVLFCIGVLSFISGIFIGSVRYIDDAVLFAGCALAVVSVAVLWRHLFWWCVPVVIVCVVLGAWRIGQEIIPSEYRSTYGQKIEFEALIVEDADMRTDKQLLTVAPKGSKQRVLVTVSTFGDYRYGDWVLVRGKITEPKVFEDFDYKKYLERYDVYGVMYYPKIIVLKQGKGSAVKSLLLDVKKQFSKRLSMHVPEPQLSLLLGLLIGARKTLPKEIVDAFALTGLSHIVAVSGYNISIIISLLEKTSRIIGRRLSVLLSGGVIIGFVVISGASSSVLRASVMGGLLLFSYAVGRLYSITPSLCAAALVMLMINPKILYWDVGFQLSFLATMGIVYMLPIFEVLCSKVPSVFGIKQLLLTTCAAILATIPITMFQFHQLSVVAPLANVLVLPLVPFAMLFGFLSALPVIGGGFAFLTNYLLTYMLAVTEKLSSLKYASLPIQISAMTAIVSFASVVCALVALHLYVKPDPAKLDKGW
jgi:competence protein ComEC